jgi:hypothetical protein
MDDRAGLWLSSPIFLPLTQGDALGWDNGAPLAVMQGRHSSAKLDWL